MYKNISFLRIRPCDNENEIYLNSRRLEGTSTFLIRSELKLEINKIHQKEFQTLSKDIEIDVDSWLINDSNWKSFIDKHPKRLIYNFKNKKEIALEIIDRLKPHTIIVSMPSNLKFLNSIKTNTKFITTAYVDNIEEVVEYLKCGISDSSKTRNNSVAYLQVRDISENQNEKVFIFNGWTFSSNPSLAPIDHAIYDIWLVGCDNV